MIRKYLLVFFVLLILSSFYAKCQDNIENKNALSVELLSPLDKTYGISYAYKLSDNVELTIKPRVRITQQNDRQSDKHFLFSANPFWYYNRFMLRTGLLLRHKQLFLEPTLQYEYGYFKNKIVCYKDGEGESSDDYMRGDRSYNSLGGISTLGFIFDYNRIRLKLYTGVGLHYRYYRETRYEEWTESYTSNHREPLNAHSSYERLIPSLHLGVEIGFRF